MFHICEIHQAFLTLCSRICFIKSLHRMDECLHRGRYSSDIINQFLRGSGKILILETPQDLLRFVPLGLHLFFQPVITRSPFYAWKSRKFQCIKKFRNTLPIPVLTRFQYPAASLELLLEQLRISARAGRHTGNLHCLAEASICHGDSTTYRLERKICPSQVTDTGVSTDGEHRRQSG